jgi:tetratricopeptide (TPR) repeat protein
MVPWVGRFGRGAALGLVAGALAACGGDAENALVRGDRLWADSNYTGALAEYRLAASRTDSEEALARVAHAYALTGQFDRAHQTYEELLPRAPEYTDQAIFDYMTLARRAQARTDRYGMAGAVEAALTLRAGLPVGDMAGPLARYYARSGDEARARDFYERALGTAPPDSVPSLLFDYAQFQEARGSCAEAIELYRAFRTREPRSERADQARWSMGNCAFALAREARQAGDPERSLGWLQITLDFGVPANLIDQAWFERGEALLEMGRGDEALQAYIRVLENVRTAGGPLAERARQRIDQIRFGTPPSQDGMETPGQVNDLTPNG